MGSDRCKRVREHGRAVSGWPIWQLRPWLVAFIGLVTAVYVAAIAVAVIDRALAAALAQPLAVRRPAALHRLDRGTHQADSGRTPG